MKQFYSVAALLAAVIFLASCKKDSASALDFSGITYTDSTCRYTGVADNSDWTLDNLWNAREFALMNFSDNAIAIDSLTGFVQVSAPCPDPSHGIFNLGVNTQVNAKMKLACVNEEFETIFYEAHICPGGTTKIDFDFTLLSVFHPGNNYRMYYAFYTSKDSMYYKGHGDFRIE